VHFEQLHTGRVQLSPAFRAALKKLAPKRRRLRLRNIVLAALVWVVAVLARDLSVREYALGHAVPETKRAQDAARTVGARIVVLWPLRRGAPVAPKRSPAGAASSSPDTTLPRPAPGESNATRPPEGDAQASGADASLGDVRGVYHLATHDRNETTPERAKPLSPRRRQKKGAFRTP
jgi:hypothetical protein